MFVLLLLLCVHESLWIGHPRLACLLHRYSWNRIREDLFHNVGGMDFHSIVNICP